MLCMNYLSLVKMLCKSGANKIAAECVIVSTLHRESIQTTFKQQKQSSVFSQLFLELSIDRKNRQTFEIFDVQMIKTDNLCFDG